MPYAATSPEQLISMHPRRDLSRGRTALLGSERIVGVFAVFLDCGWLNKGIAAAIMNLTGRNVPDLLEYAQCELYRCRGFGHGRMHAVSGLLVVLRSSGLRMSLSSIKGCTRDPWR